MNIVYLGIAVTFFTASCFLAKLAERVGGTPWKYFTG